MLQEKRRAPRREIQRSVQVVTLNDSRPPMSCTLLDISQSGARLYADDQGTLPNEFLLVLRDDLKKMCRVIRRSRTEIGVRFIESKPAA
jgi:hypothetical protein